MGRNRDLYFYKTENVKDLFVNLLILHGRKLWAEYRLISLFFALKQFNRFLHFEIFYMTLMKLRPLIFLRKLRLGSVLYKIPAPIKDNRKKFFSVKVILSSACTTNRRIVFNSLVGLFRDVFLSRKNLAVTKKLTLYLEGSSNRLFIRFLK